MSNGKLLKPGTYFMTGNIAVAEAALIAGCRFYAGYPITPSSDLMEHMAKRLPQVGGVFIQGEDEIASINMVLGASAAGLKSMTATSGPGLSLMEEALDLGFMLELPAVIVDVQRVGPSTGIPTLGSQGDVMQAIWGSHGDREVVVYAPSSIQEAFDFTIRAFNTAEELRMPVVLLSDELIGHGYGRLRVPELNEIKIVDRKRAEDPEGYKPFETGEGLVPLFAEPGKGFRLHMTGLVHDERGYPIIDKEVTEKLLTRLLRKVRDNRDKLVDYEVYPQDIDRVDAVIVAYGSIASITKLALRYIKERGYNTVLFRPKVLWPMPDKELCRVVEERGAEKVIVVEMNYGQYLHMIKAALVDCPKPCRFVPVTPGFYPSARVLAQEIERVLRL